ncbi:hypothetical protein ACFE04_004274 [Oxalis oulophora]
MNPPSPNLVLEGEQEVNQQRREKPQWLDAFLAQTCRYCMLSGIHGDHHTIKIYRHVYQNAVCLMTMSQYLDCDQIQCNKNLVVSLKPLPHNGLATYADEICCKTCRRKLMDPTVVDYCSILCKTIAFDNKENKNIPPFLSHVANRIDEEENGEMEEHEQVMTDAEQQVFNVNHKEVVNAELALVERESESESEPEPIVVIVEDDQDAQQRLPMVAPLILLRQNWGTVCFDSQEPQPVDLEKQMAVQNELEGRR